MKAIDIIKKLSNEHLLALEKIAPQKYKEIFETTRLNKYIAETDFENLLLEDRKVCVIEKGEWDYPLFQVSFMSNMLANMVDCLSRGYLPVVCFKNTKDNINLWEQFLKQLTIYDNSFQYELVYEKARASLFFPVIPSKEDIDKISKLVKKLVVPNETTKNYIENEYKNIIAGKRVLGVLCRGTDYTSNKPKGHPVQPPINELIIHIKKKILELNCEYIYLATEEEHIFNQFDEAFPNMILTNKRHYYDDFYKIKEKSGELTRISWVSSGRENDNYYKSLEYISSIYLLSKCDALIAGNCGGSRAALYLNGNRYSYTYLFDLGLY